MYGGSDLQLSAEPYVGGVADLHPVQGHGRHDGGTLALGRLPTRGQQGDLHDLGFKVVGFRVGALGRLPTRGQQGDLYNFGWVSKKR